MSFLLHPLHVVAAVFTEWVRHKQEKVIEFLRTGTEFLLEQLGDKRILLSDDVRRLLAVKGMAFEKEDLENACVIVQPDTLRRKIRWASAGITCPRSKLPQPMPRPSLDVLAHNIMLLLCRYLFDKAVRLLAAKCCRNWYHISLPRWRSS
jgi:hypothetical protein